MSETEINEDNCVLDRSEIYDLKLALDFVTRRRPEVYKNLDTILSKITKLNEMAKEKKETEKIGLLGKDADAIVFSEYSIGNEFKEKGK